MTNPLLEDRVHELSREFGEEVVEDALLTLALRRRSGISQLLERLGERRSIPDWDWLDVAAILATRHDVLGGEESLARNWLALFVLRERLFGSVEGAPDSVLGDLIKSMSMQTQIQQEVIRTVWEEPMLRPVAVAAALGWRNAYHQKIRRYRLRSWLVGFLSEGAYHYLAFQFDPERHDVFPEVREVNERLEAASDPWGVASWWISAHDRLGARPADLVGSDRAGDLLKAANAALEPIG